MGKSDVLLDRPLLDRPLRFRPLVVLMAVLAMVLPLTAATPALAAVASRVSLGVSPASATPAETVVLSGVVSPAATGRRVSLQRLGSKWSTVTTVKTNAKGRYTASVRAGVAGSKTSWRAVALKTTTAAQAISATRTLKVVRQTLSLTAPSSAETRLGFTLAGYASPARTGRTVAVQRRSGASWVEVGRAKESSSGRYSVRITAGSVGRYTYRAVALSWRRAAAVVSPSRVVTVRAPYILLTRSTAIAAETVKASGKLPGVYSRAVWVQRKSGASWVTLVKARTTRTGSYSTSFRAPKVGSYAVRALAPKATVARRVRAQYASPAKTLKVVAQTASLSMPATLLTGTTGTATVKFAPARAGRAVTLQVSSSGVWTALATGKQSSTGAASLTMTAGTPSAYPYRAWTSASSGAPGFATPTRTLTVTAETTVPPADVTAPGPVTGVTATATATTETSITLSWTNPTDSDFTGVMIRRAAGLTPPASASAGTLVTDAAKPVTTFTDTGLTSGTQYSYAFFAHDGIPNHSAATNLTASTTTSTPEDTTAPGPVTGVSANATATTATSITLSWTNPADLDFSGVMIRRAAGLTPPASASAGTLVTDAAKPVTTVTDTGLTSGTQYSYAFFAHDVVPNYSEVTNLTASTTVAVSNGAISGTVTEAGTPNGLAKVEVYAFSQSTGSDGFVTTAADGSYTVPGLKAGTDYQVCFYAAGATGGSSEALGYLNQCWQNQPDWGTATLVAVTAGAPTTGIDAALAVGGAISGTVTEAGEAGTGLADVNVWVSSPTIESGGGSATTTADGRYTVHGLPAGTDYQVCFYASNAKGGSTDALGYLRQCWENQPTEETATPVAVALGETTPRIDAALATGGAISGKVSQAGVSDRGLAGVQVSVSSPTTGSYGYTTTTADGGYTVTGLAEGADYKVCFDASIATGGSADAAGYVNQCWENQPTEETAILVSVTLGETTPRIDAAIAAYGAISGKVSQAGVADPGLAGVQVYVSSPTTGSYGYTTTTADGSYTVPRLQTGTDYQVCFDASSATGGSSDEAGYLNQCWQNKPTDGTATPVAVTMGATTPGIDAALAVGGAISGTVTEAGDANLGLSNVFVQVTSQSGGSYGYATTADNGSYKVPGLKAGTDYQVCFDASNATGGSSDQTGYVNECWENQPTWGTSTPVEVNLGAPTTGIDAVLAVGGAISGTVTQVGDAQLGLSNVRVSVSSPTTSYYGSARTADNGSYTVTGLETGADYQVCFDASIATGGSADEAGYVNQCWENQPTSETATSVAVTLGAPTTGIDAILAVGGAISGTVTEAGDPNPGLSEVYVQVTSPTTGASATAWTAANGSYTVLGLPAGTDYQVCFDPSFAFVAGGTRNTAGYVAQCWENQPTSDTATPVAVALSAPTTGIDAVISAYGTISGKVTQAGDTHPGLANVDVWVSSPTTAASGSTSTAADGSYTVSGLAAGTDYWVCFYASGATGGSSDEAGYIGECYDNQPWETTPVSVTLGEATTGIDAVLAVGGAVSGTVTEAGGSANALVDVWVNAYSPTTGASGYTSTAANGTYTLRGLLPATDYQVCFYASAATGGSSDAAGYIDECYNDQQWDAPTPVTVALGEITPGIDAALVGNLARPALPGKGSPLLAPTSPFSLNSH